MEENKNVAVSANISVGSVLHVDYRLRSVVVHSPRLFHGADGDFGFHDGAVKTVDMAVSVIPEKHVARLDSRINVVVVNTPLLSEGILDYIVLENTSEREFRTATSVDDALERENTPFLCPSVRMPVCLVEYVDGKLV